MVNVAKIAVGVLLAIALALGVYGWMLARTPQAPDHQALAAAHVARREHLVAAGEHDAAHRRVGAQLGEHLRQQGLQLQAQGIGGLRPVQADHGNAVFRALQQGRRHSIGRVGGGGDGGHAHSSQRTPGIRAGWNGLFGRRGGGLIVRPDDEGRACACKPAAYFLSGLLPMSCVPTSAPMEAGALFARARVDFSTYEG